MVPNALSAETFSDILFEQVGREVALNHSAEPFDQPPFENFVSNSLGVTSKENGVYRIIMDLSRPENRSVNSFIDPTDYSLAFCSVDDAVRMLTSLGVDSFMCKMDVQHGFRPIPLRQDD